MQPKINKKTPFLFRNCTKCGESLGPDYFIKINSYFYPDGYCPVCNGCLKEYLLEHNFDWHYVDKICQYLDVPFVPKEFERLKEMNGEDVLPIYVAVFQAKEYEGLGWSDYFKEFKKLEEVGAIEDELPLLSEAKRRKLKLKWGANYDDEDLQYLENLYDGLLATQNVNGALQTDQALKICKISLELDTRIREGVDFDKMLTSYDKLVKVAEFTPKNVKNINDLDSVGELIKWLEKRGWKNKYYDDVTRDIVDETMKNIQAYNQRLYTNESDIGEEISRRIESLKEVAHYEHSYDTIQDFDTDEYEVEGYDELLTEEEFEADTEGGSDA